MKVLIAGFVGGLVVFVWGAVSHMLLPLGEKGLSSMPDVASEQAVQAELGAKLGKSGLYLLPSVGREQKDEAGQEAFAARVKAGPTAFVVFHPDGTELGGKQFGLEFLSNVLAACLAAFIVSRMPESMFLTRVLVVALLGAFGWLSIEASYWIWYRFPDDYVLAQAIDQTVGWGIAGVAIAAMVRGKPAEA